MAEVTDIIKKVVRHNKGEPLSSFKLTYDSQQNQLEPIYYWILDFLQDGGWRTEKVVDNFMSSPGSGHFSEISQRVSRLQEEGMKILGGLNQVIKSCLNLIYDLKEFKLRLAHYEDYFSNDEKRKEAGMLALKQIWLDNVDIKRGRGSIHNLANELGFSTIREAFMIARDVEDLKKMNKDDEGGLLNDQVMRILIPRLSEFLKWTEYSYNELKKRYNIEKSYLKSQVETVKIYSSWIKPYIKAAEQLRQKGFDGNAALVNAFSTSLFELTLFARKEVKGPPKHFGSYNLKRKYHPFIVVTLRYRGHVSQKVTQKGDYGFVAGGRVDMFFYAYAINSEELELIKKEIQKDDFISSASIGGNLAEESLEELKKDLDEFLNEKESSDKKDFEKDKKKEEDVNPFSALFSIFKKNGSDKKEEKKEIKSQDDIKPDNYIEDSVRALAAKDSTSGLFSLYDVFKKVHGMASSPEPFDNGMNEEYWEKKAYGGSVSFKDAFKRNFEDLS